MDLDLGFDRPDLEAVDFHPLGDLEVFDDVVDVLSGGAL